MVKLATRKFLVLANLKTLPLVVDYNLNVLGNSFAVVYVNELLSEKHQ